MLKARGTEEGTLHHFERWRANIVKAGTRQDVLLPGDVRAAFVWGLLLRVSPAESRAAS